MKVATFLSVALDERVDALMADDMLPLPLLESPCDLVGTSLVPQLPLNVRAQTRIVVPARTIVVGMLSPFHCASLGTGRAVPATLPRTAPGKFPADRGLVAANNPGDGFLRMTGAVQGFDLIPPGSGKVVHTVKGVGSNAPSLLPFLPMEVLRGRALRYASSPSSGMRFTFEFPRQFVDKFPLNVLLYHYVRRVPFRKGK